MTDDELTALVAANRELAAIGRNINQIARALNEARLIGAAVDANHVKLEQLAELREAITRNRAAIRALVRASQNSWADDAD